MSYRKVNSSLRLWHLVASGNTQPVTETWNQVRMVSDYDWGVVSRAHCCVPTFDLFANWPSGWKKAEEGWTIHCHLPPVQTWKLINHDPRISVGEADWPYGIRADVFHLDKCVRISNIYIYLMDEFWAVFPYMEGEISGDGAIGSAVRSEFKLCAQSAGEDSIGDRRVCQIGCLPGPDRFWRRLGVLQAVLSSTSKIT